MVSENESVTRTTESGAFIRTVIRHGKKRKQETKRIRKNDKKVVLGMIGEFEVYVYPYDFPDTVFVGKFPVSTKVTTSNVAEVIASYNKMRSFLEGYYFSEPNSRKGTNSRRQHIHRAYNLGLATRKELKKDSVWI